jgi:hypothetical protein
MMTSAQIDQAVYNTAIKQGFNPIAAKLIVAQARFESSDYTSNVFLKNNNTSGMKYIGASQINAQRGTPAPSNERTCNLQCDRDFYARFNTVQDSINDVIKRLYTKTMGGVTPQMLKDSTSADDFARKLKMRSYYGFGKLNSTDPSKVAQAESEIKEYAGGMRAKLLRIQVVEFVEKNKVNLGIVGALIIGITAYIYYLKKNKIV